MQKLGKLTTCAVVLLSATIPEQTNAVSLNKSQHQGKHSIAHNESKSSTVNVKNYKDKVAPSQIKSGFEGEFTPAAQQLV